MNMKWKVDQSYLNAEDVNISWSKDDLEVLRKQKNRKGDDEDTVRINRNSKAARKKTAEPYLLDVSSVSNLSEFYSVGEDVSDEEYADETQRYSVMKEHSENPVNFVFDKYVKMDNDASQLKKQTCEKEESDSADEGSRERGRKNNLTQIDKEKLIEKKRWLEIQIRKDTLEKNKINYILSKNSNLDDETMNYRECPCCNKPITKLCFKCEHLQCNPESCPRKKKQRLNARMLERMKKNRKKQRRGKKEGEDEGRERSRDEKKHLPRVKEEKSYDQTYSDDESFEDEEESEFQSLSFEEEAKPPKPQQKQNIPAPRTRPSWKTTTISFDSNSNDVCYPSDEEQSNKFE